MSDPLGLTADQRADSLAQEYLDRIVSGEIRDRNIEMIRDLPAGTMVRVMGGPMMTRERLLELID